MDEVFLFKKNARCNFMLLLGVRYSFRAQGTMSDLHQAAESRSADGTSGEKLTWANQSLSERVGEWSGTEDCHGRPPGVGAFLD